MNHFFSRIIQIQVITTKDLCYKGKWNQKYILTRVAHACNPSRDLEDHGLRPYPAKKLAVIPHLNQQLSVMVPSHTEGPGQKRNSS
jgi:hypothetical protein